MFDIRHSTATPASLEWCAGSCKEKKKKNYIFSSQLRADQMPGPPREVQLTNDFFLDSHHHV